MVAQGVKNRTSIHEDPIGHGKVKRKVKIRQAERKWESKRRANPG